MTLLSTLCEFICNPLKKGMVSHSTGKETEAQSDQIRKTAVGIRTPESFSAVLSCRKESTGGADPPAVSHITVSHSSIVLNRHDQLLLSHRVWHWWKISNEQRKVAFVRRGAKWAVNRSRECLIPKFRSLYASKLLLCYSFPRLLCKVLFHIEPFILRVLPWQCLGTTPSSTLGG